MADASPITDPVDNAPSGDAFYTPPDPLPDGQPGDPVYQRPLDNDVAALEDGDNWLVLYRSEDVHGRPIAVSGIIVLPRTEQPLGGYPVISWAHGTVGVADRCAPSRDTTDSLAHPMNAYPQTLLNEFLRLGWAVAMTDYEGLGTTDRTHPYLLGQSEAYGVLTSSGLPSDSLGPGSRTGVPSSATPRAAKRRYSPPITRPSGHRSCNSPASLPWPQPTTRSAWCAPTRRFH